jgi:transcriptional regulator with XRE-family HTH domain
MIIVFVSIGFEKIFLWSYSMADFRENIRRIRVKKKLTQRQAAELLGISMRAYQHYEAGTREPNMETLRKMTEVLDVSADDLIGRKENHV